MKKLGISLLLAFIILLIAFSGLTPLEKFTPWPTFAAGSHHVANNCSGVPLPCYLTVQAALDVAATGDVIKVAAGTYSTLNNYGGEKQIAYISKTITLQGGYGSAFTEPPDPKAQPTILNAGGQGRGLYITGTISPTIQGLQITGGNAFNGGGIYIDIAAAHLKDLWVYSNTATFLGGGIYAIGGATIENSRINTNTANSGGGGVLLAGGGGILQNEGSAKFISNTVSHNTACYAGGVDLVLSTAILTANIIHDNIANFCTSGDSGIGGGIIIDQESSAILVNNLIFENKADIAGSGIFISGSSPRLWHSTIAGNFGGNGSGIHIMDRFGVLSTVSFTNTILVSHTLGITVANNNTATLESTLWFNNLTNWAGAGSVITGTNNFSGSPAFINPGHDNYHLQVSSAAIDKGIATVVQTDIDGDNRDSKPDLGMDEVEHSSAYLPLILKN